MTSTVIASLGALYLAIANIWNLPYGTQVSNTAFELAAFISAVLGAFTFHSVIGSVGSDILKDIGKEDK
jgi:hypothetical protein